MDRATSVEVRGAPNRERGPLREHVVERPARRLDRASGVVVDGDGRLAVGGGRPAPALGLDQVAHAVASGAHHRGGAAHGGGHDLVVDDDDTQVLAGDTLLEQHGGAEGAGERNRPVEVVVVGDAHGDALALLATGGLDHDVAHLGKERMVAIVEGGVAPGGQVQAGGGEDAPGVALVVAPAHGDGGG